MILQWRHYILLMLLSFLLSLPGRMSLPPLDRDEPRYMEATEQMLSSKNFLDIRYQDQARYLQPAGIYWLEATAVKISETTLGINLRHTAWPYRLPSLIAASLIIPLTVWLGTALFNAEVGLLAAAFLMASTLVSVETRMATTDTVLLLDILIVESLYLHHFQDYIANKKTPYYITVGFWLALGCGLMVKGPIILIPGLGTPLALSLIERNLSLWRCLSPLWGWILMLSVGLPWFVSITLISHGDFFSRAIMHNLLGKIGHAQESHGFPPGYYLLVFLLSFWPGSLFFAYSLPKIWQNRSSPSVRFLLCWIIPHWILFELLATKLPHYVLPTFPAIAILTAASLIIWPACKGYSQWANKIFVCYSSLWTLVGILFCSVSVFLLTFIEHTISTISLIILTISIFLLVCSLWFFYCKKVRISAYYSVATAILIHIGIFTTLIPIFSPIQLSQKIAISFHQNKFCPNSVLISTSYYEPSLVFLVGEKTRLLSPSLAAKSLYKHMSCDLALVDIKDYDFFIKQLKEKNIVTHTITEISGLNYSNGHHMHLKLISASQEINDNKIKKN